MRQQYDFAHIERAVESRGGKLMEITDFIERNMEKGDRPGGHYSRGHHTWKAIAMPDGLTFALGVHRRDHGDHVINLISIEPIMVRRHGKLSSEPMTSCYVTWFEIHEYSHLAALAIEGGFDYERAVADLICETALQRAVPSQN